MMLPGPQKAIYCPYCEQVLSYQTLSSGNTCGATRWSDGKQVAPMMPLPPDIAKCAHCAQCFWLETAEACHDCEPTSHWTGPLIRKGIPVPLVSVPTEQDYYDAFCADFFEDKDQEIRARILAWWRCNDPQRSPNPPPFDWKARKTELWRDNLLSLEYLLDEQTDEHYLMKAEIFRHQGYYDSAESCLRAVKTPELQDIVRQMKQWCAERNTRVMPLL